MQGKQQQGNVSHNHQNQGGMSSTEIDWPSAHIRRQSINVANGSGLNEAAGTDQEAVNAKAVAPAPPSRTSSVVTPSAPDSTSPLPYSQRPSTYEAADQVRDNTSILNITRSESTEGSAATGAEHLMLLALLNAHQANGHRSFGKVNSQRQCSTPQMRFPEARRLHRIRVEDHETFLSINF
jgi:hypothetical protein